MPEARSLPGVALLLTCSCIGLLLFNAATTTVWDDEVAGFFLARQPVAEIWRQLADHVHEDPPLFYVWLHYWIIVAGHRPWLLRLPSIVCFCGAAWGTYSVATYLAGERAGWYALIATAVLPYHWLFPAALRWYALFACLSIWNFRVFLQLWSVTRQAGSIRPWLAAYIVSGSLMWYTNYTAPLYFLCHLVIVLLWDPQRQRIVSRLAIGWLLITVSYAPWLTVFAGQLPISIITFGESWRSWKVVALCLYVLWAGEISSPFVWWISLPVAAAAVSAVLLFAWRPVPARVPAVALVILTVGLALSGTLWTKRLLLVSPFLAMWLGMTLAAAVEHSGSRAPAKWVRAVRLVFAGAAIVAITGSLRNLITRDGWISYRWIDPIEEVVGRVMRFAPDSRLVTNSDSVMFYLRSPCSLWAEACDDTVPAVYPDLDDPSWVRVAPLPARVSYIHHSADRYFSSTFDELKRILQQEGYRVTAVEPFLPVSPEFDAYVPHRSPHGADAQYDLYRLIAVQFERRPER